MSSINFEEDQAKVITKTGNIQSLADQVERLENLNQEIEKTEKDFLKNGRKVMIRRSIIFQLFLKISFLTYQPKVW